MLSMPVLQTPESGRHGSEQASVDPPVTSSNAHPSQSRVQWLTTVWAFVCLLCRNLLGRELVDGRLDWIQYHNDQGSSQLPESSSLEYSQYKRLQAIWYRTEMTGMAYSLFRSIVSIRISWNNFTEASTTTGVQTCDFPEITALRTIVLVYMLTSATFLLPTRLYRRMLMSTTRDRWGSRFVVGRRHWFHRMVRTKLFQIQRHYNTVFIVSDVVSLVLFCLILQKQWHIGCRTVDLQVVAVFSCLTVALVLYNVTGKSIVLSRAPRQVPVTSDNRAAELVEKRPKIDCSQVNPEDAVDNIDADCSICACELWEDDGSQDNVVVELERCHHLFHQHCIEKWLTFSMMRSATANATCPVCRSVLTLAENEGSVHVSII